MNYKMTCYVHACVFWCELQSVTLPALLSPARSALRVSFSGQETVNIQSGTPEP